MRINDTMFLRNLREVISALRGDSASPAMRCMYGEIYTIKRESVKNWNSVHIRKTSSFFNYWGYGAVYGKMIAAIDYTICDACIKINHLCVNDNADDDMTDEDSHNLASALIQLVNAEAKEYNKSKLVVVVENNLSTCRKYYSNNGFVMSREKCTASPLWIEMELPVENSAEPA